jgi:DNA-binding transcriptional regulator LsrR (DeoR family)
MARKSKITKAMRERAHFLYSRTHMPQAAIARHLELSESTVAKILKTPGDWKPDEKTPRPTKYRIQN